MASTPDDSSLSSDQDTNRFLMYAGLNPRSLIKPSETEVGWMDWIGPNELNWTKMDQTDKN